MSRSARWGLFSLVSALLLSLAIVFSPIAEAGKGWCRGDPIVTVGGVQYSVEVAVNFGAGGSTIYPDRYSFYYNGLPYSLDAVDDGVDGDGEEIRFINSLLDGHVGVRIYITADTQYPMEVYVNGVLMATGTTNSHFRIPLN